ncbi:MAG TPA: prenyltransferase/squalene oxidase repeat-containing protein [Thermoanaerobaculia bacterium]|nr:prenyltransferase/squalene oxidase repeat-containing protein [Thermoanaerobaculia bacterium]
MTTITRHAGPAVAGGDLFPPEIEAATAAVTASLLRLQERWPGAVQLGITTRASIYHSYPHLFLGAFPGLDAARIEPLCLAASLFADSLFVADDLMDDDATDRDTTTNVVRVQAMQLEGYYILHDLFPPQARFWDRFRDYLALYAAACIDERRFAQPAADWSELTQPLALRIAKGKSSLAKFVTAGLGELAGDEAPIEPLSRALDRYYVARQMIDDLSDWRQDLERGYPSLLLARVAGGELAGLSPPELARRSEEVGRALYGAGHARYVVELALHALAEGEALASPYPDLLWHRVMARLRGRSETLLGELERLATRAETVRAQGPRRLELTLPPPDDPWQEIAWDALRFLVRGWQAGAGDGNAPPEERERRRRPATAGGLLGRALVADALCDADELLDGGLRPVIEGQAAFLLEHRQAGGWGWAAVLPGLPADAWHLAGVLRLLDRLGWRAAIEEHCAPLVAELLSRQTADGALPTWLSGKTERPSGEPDELVAAELLDALARYDRERFRTAVERGAGWIESRQRPDGSWTSPGVHGPHLPTVACIELLAAIRPGSSALAAAADFLRRSQRHDGGWGVEGAAADGANTAIALLGLARLQVAAGDEHDPQLVDRACRGRQALLASAPFDAAPPVGGGILTAAFALQAAVAWHRVEQRASRLAVAIGGTP